MRQQAKHPKIHQSRATRLTFLAAVELRVHVLLIESFHGADKWGTGIFTIKVVHVDGEVVDRGVDSGEIVWAAVDVNTCSMQAA